MAVLQIFVGLMLILSLVSLAGLLLLRQRQRGKTASVFDTPGIFQTTAAAPADDDDEPIVPGPNEELSDAEKAAFAALSLPLVEPEPPSGAESEGAGGLAGVLAGGTGDSEKPPGGSSGLAGLEDGLRGMFKTASEADGRLQGFLDRVEEVDANDLFEEIKSLTSLIRATSKETGPES